VIHTIIVIVLIYAAVRAILRRTPAASDIRGTIKLVPSYVPAAELTSFPATVDRNNRELHEKIHEDYERGAAARSAKYWAEIMKRRAQFEATLT
jgi:hypothetical protein